MPANSHVDERVVEMRIDNKKFESGAKNTISLLEKLENALKFKSNSKAIDNAADSVERLGRSASKFDASNMTNSIEKVTASFTALEIVGMRVISNLTDSVYNFVAKTVKSVTIDQVAAGFQKFGDKTTSVATLVAQGYELEKVNDLMAQLNWFTDETSYNFTDMVGNIAKFTATGQDLDSSVTAMEGIALWAALSGQNATKASMAMYQLSQAMSKGALKYDDYKSIQNASMDTQEFRMQAAAAAEQLGILKKEAEGLWALGEKKYTLNELFTSDALSRDQWFSSDVMMMVFNRYAGAVDELRRLMNDQGFDVVKEALDFLDEEVKKGAEAGKTANQVYKELGYTFDEFSIKAFKAGQTARTWTDTIDSIKDAVSTGWMNTFELLFGDMEAASSFFSDMAEKLYDIFAEGGNIRNEILEYAGFGRKKASSGWDKFTNQLNEAGHTLDEFETSYHKVVDSIDDPAIKDAITKFDSVEEAFKNGAISADIYKKILEELSNQTNKAADDTEEAAEKMEYSLEEYKKVALEVLRGEHGNGEERRKELEELGYDYETIQWLAGNLQWSPNVSDDQLIEWMNMYHPEYLEHMMKTMGATDEEIAVMNEMLNNTQQTLDEMTQEAEEEVDLGEAFRETITNVVDAFSTLQNTVRTAFNNVFRYYDKSEGRWVEGTEVIGGKIRDVILNIRDYSRTIGFSTEGLIGFRKTVEAVIRVFRVFGTVGGGVFKAIFSVAQQVFGFIDDVFSMIGKEELTVGNVLKALNERLRALIPTSEDIQNGIRKIGAAFVSLIPSEEQLINFYRDLKEQIRSLPSKIFGFFSNGGLKEMLPSLEKAKELYHEFTGYIEKSYPRLTAWFRNWKASTFIGNLLSNANKDIQSITNWINNLHFDSTGMQAFLDQFKQYTSFLTAGLTGDKETIKTSVDNFVTTVIDSLKTSLEGKKFELKDLLEVLKTSGIVAVLLSLAGVLNKLRKIGEQSVAIGEAFTDFVDEGKNVLKAVQKSIAADAIVKIAAALLILSIAMVALSKVPKDELTHVATVLGLLLALMFGIAKKLEGSKVLSGKFIKVSLFGTLGSILIGFAMILGALSALTLIAKNLKLGQLIGIFAAVAAIMGRFIIVAKKMSNLEFKNPTASIISIFAFAMAINMLIPMLLMFGLMPWDAVKRSVLGMAGIIGVMIVALAAMSRINDRNPEDGAKSILRMAASMAIMAAAVRMMMVPLAVLGAIPKEILIQGFIAVAVLMAMMTGVGFLMNLIKPAAATGILAVAGAMALFALAIRLLVPAIIELATFITLLAVTIPWENLTDRMDAFLEALKPIRKAVGLLIAFGLAVGLVGFGLLMASAGFFGFVVVLGLLGVALIAFSKGISTFVDSLNHIFEATSGKTWIALIGATAVLALMAVAISKLVKVCNGKNGSIIGGFFGKLGGSLLKMGGEALSKITAQLPKILPVVLQILGTILIASAVYFVGLMPQLVDIGVQAIITFFNSLSKSMEDNKDQLIESITSIIHSIIDVIKGVVENLWKTASPGEKWVAGIAGVLLGLRSIFNFLAGGAGPAAAGIGKVQGAAEGLFNAAVKITETKGAFRALRAAASLLLESLGGIAVVGPVAAVAIAGIGAGISISRTEAQFMKDAFDGLGTSTTDYATATQRLEEEIKNLTSDRQMLADSGADLTMIDNQIAEKQNVLRKIYADLATQLGITTEELYAQMEAANGDIMMTDAMIQKTEELARASSDAESFKAWRESNGKLNNDGIRETTNDFNNLNLSIGDTTASLQGLVDNFKNGMIDDSGLKEGVKSIISAAGEIPSGAKEGVLANVGEFTGSIDTMSTDGILEFLKVLGIASPSGVMSEAAVNIPEGAAEGVKNNTPVAVDAMSALGSSMMNGINEHINTNAPISGSNAVTGLINGVNERMQDIYNIGWNTGRAFMRGYDEATKTRSPSREMMERGAFAIKGLLIGLQNNEDSIYKESYGIGTGLISAMQMAMSQVGMMASNDFTISPRITPIVDMSNVRYASNAANSMFGSLQSSYMASALARSSDISETVDYNLSNNDVIQEIQVLSQQLVQLEDAVTNMQIVLDTGVLVGSTSSKMDKQFGKMAMRRGRGN